jgi:HAMP domain-containing protein
MKTIWWPFKSRAKPKGPSKNKTRPDKNNLPPEADKRLPEELTLKRIGKKEPSPLNRPVWRLSVLVVAGCLLTWFFHLLLGFTHPAASWLVALIALITWGFAVRMLLLDGRFKNFWIGWTALCIVSLIAVRSVEDLWIAAVGGSFIFLLFRKYRPYRHLTSRRRAALFLLGFLVFCLLAALDRGGRQWELVEPPQGGVVLTQETEEVNLGLGAELARYASGSLELFWIFSLVHIFFRARLHFMKLRPKLAVSAFLIAVVPAILIILMGLLTLYGALGATRGARVRSILNDWAELSDGDENFIPSFFASSFTYEHAGPQVKIRGVSPSWLKGFLTDLHAEGSPYAEKPVVKETDYLWVEPEVWLLRLNIRSRDELFLQGGILDRAMMNRLAKIVRSDVSFAPSMMLTVSGKELTTIKPETTQPLKKIEGKYIPQEGPQETSSPEIPSLWHRPLYFGLSDLDIIAYQSGKIEKRKILLVIETSLATIFEELISKKNPFAQAVMIALIALGAILLVFEAAMLFFGLRITTGFTSAVRTLYKGTRRIAAGDLDSRIEIPNEDELGDLAASFNVMSKAVKKGREEAILRVHMESELQTARKIQEKLLPHDMPQLPGFEIAGASLPSREVGGDYFDFLDLEGGRLGIAIADVSGKGIPAALLMANLQASLHAQVLEERNVAHVAARINNLLVQSTDSNMFVTFFYGLLDRNLSTFTSVNAGHNPPILLRSEGQIERLEKGGLILGFLQDQKFEQETTSLQPGDIMVLYTDGITESIDPDPETPDDKLFGEERLIKIVRWSADLAAREIQGAVLQAVTAHTQNTPQNDDITLVVIKRRKD